MRQHHVLSTTTPDNCKKTLYDDLLLLPSWTCVIRVVLSVSYLLVSYFVMNFLRHIFSVCHSFRNICQAGRMEGFERCFKVEDQGTWRRQNIHAAILRPPAKRIQIKLYEPHLGITKSDERLNKPCHGNVNGRKSFAAEGFNVKIPSLAKHIRKLWQFPSDKVILELVILLNITQGSFLLNLSMRWLALMRRCARRVRENLIDIAKYGKNVIETECRQDYR